MEYLIIGIAYIFVIYMFYNIKKIKKNGKNKGDYNKIYFSIIMTFICFSIWGVIRMIPIDNFIF